MASQAKPLVVGLSIPQDRIDAGVLLQSAQSDGYDFVTTVLPHSQTPRSDVTVLSGRWWRTSIVGVIPEPPSPEALIERLSFQFEWGMHMGIPAIILPAPTGHVVVEYARIIQALALDAQNNNLQIWIKTNLNEKSLREYEILHRLCDGLCNIGMMLVMEPIPTMNSAAATVASQIVLLHKAIGANLKAVCFPTKVFLTNKRGYPTLAKSHQVIFTEVLKRVGRTIRVLLDGPSVHMIPNAGDGMGVTNCLPYLQYIRHMRQRPEVSAELDSDQATMENAYLDSLQRPLQPLKDHLEFSMYETFEKDPIKYQKYEDATYMALSDLCSMAFPKQITILVAGAGRGPLVTRAINAFQKLNIPPGTLNFRVYAVEKNPSAAVYLESAARFKPEWQGIVKVVPSDARQLKKSQIDGNTIDIVVSELLGSFGDNELSPECLDPLLCSESCSEKTISIPQEYTSYLAPVSSIRLHTDAKQQAQVPHDAGQPLGIIRAMETSYVVRSHAASQTHPEQKCWTFKHPPTDQKKERSAALEFSPDPTSAAAVGCGYGSVDPAIASIVGQAVDPIPGPITIHGFLGSFSATLYQQGDNCCEISIAPHSFSKEMFSWFPLYFPFREPLHVPAGSNISAYVWRKTSDGKVWYEWCAKVHRKGEVIEVTPIHNPNGRSSYVSM